METTKISWQEMQVERLFAAFDRKPTQAQTKEWIDIVGRFRPDDATNAISVLIETAGRLPTIAQFRQESMKFYTERVRESRQDEVPPIIARIERDAENENREYWRSKFGEKGDAIRQRVGEICLVAEKQRLAAETLAEVLNLKVTTEERIARFEIVAAEIQVAGERTLRRRLAGTNNSNMTTHERLRIKKIIDAHLGGW